VKYHVFVMPVVIKASDVSGVNVRV